jgi:hypothetical protein
MLAGVLPLLVGCLSDPNHMAGVRYLHVLEHAAKTLDESGSSLKPFKPDYQLMIFRREPDGLVIEGKPDLELYDFFKTTSERGPDRFVIVYDRRTRETYLRDDLRSNENLERWPDSE